MLLRKRREDHRFMIGAGQISFLVAALLFVVSIGSYPWAMLRDRFGDVSLITFLQGFLAGLASVLMGLSIVLNVRGLMLRRRQESSPNWRIRSGDLTQLKLGQETPPNWRIRSGDLTQLKLGRETSPN